MKLTDNKELTNGNTVVHDKLNHTDKLNVNCKSMDNCMNCVKEENTKTSGNNSTNIPLQLEKSVLEDAVTVKKDLEQMRKNISENNLNMNKEDDFKPVKHLTEELSNLRLGYGKDKPNVKIEKCASIQSACKSGSINMQRKNCAECKGVIINDITDDITTGLKGIMLDSKIKAKDSSKDFIFTNTDNKGQSAMKIHQSCESAELAKQDEELIAVVVHAERRGEENEDFEKTCILSNSNFLNDESFQNGQCISLIAHGPQNGIPRNKGIFDDDYDDDDGQPRKFFCPQKESQGPPVNNLHMCGGHVEVFQPNFAPKSLVNPKHLESLNVTAVQYEKVHRQPDFMPLVNGMNEISFDMIDFTSKLDQREWSQNVSFLTSSVRMPNDDLHPYHCGLSNGFPSNLNVSTAIDEIPLSQTLLDSHLNGGYMPYHLAESSAAGIYVNSQRSAGSPSDQGLSSPGSSPPSNFYSPYSIASPLNNDYDIIVQSPSSFSISSPESGIVGDQNDVEWEIVHEYLAEQGFQDEDNVVERDPPIPEIVMDLNRRNDPISDSAMPCSLVVSTSKSASAVMKKPPSRQKNSNKPQQPRILPPVENNNVQSSSVLQQPGFFINQVPATIPILIVPPGKPLQQQAPIQPRPIQPKRPLNASSPASVSPSSQMNASISGTPQFVPPVSVPIYSVQSPPSQDFSVSSSSDQDQMVKAYRWVAGLTKEKLIIPDDDGDTVLHILIVKEQKMLIKALLERYVREGLIEKVINLGNNQHQTPLCLAVFLNQTNIVKMLIERGADANVQLQRKRNCGLMCYRLIHFASKRGKKWVPTLMELLKSKNLDLHAFDSEGCTAIHSAIKAHGEVLSELGKIDSRDTIYYLAMHGANLNHQHGLSNKTPLHFAIEMKDSELVSWFLGLASHVQSNGIKLLASSNSLGQSLVNEIVNAKPSNGITALQLALNIQMDYAERVKILETLLKHGAEISQRSCDGKLRQELGKYSELAPLLKIGTSLTKNGR